MPDRIGIIQTQKIGDLIIALPIADFYIEQGAEVFWPIRPAYRRAFQAAKPDIRFLEVPDKGEGMYAIPHEMLTQHQCSPIFTLYSYLARSSVTDEGLARHLKFDEYKYAIAHVPFARKWNLTLQRDMQREMALHQRLNITRPYLCVHLEGSNLKLNGQLPDEWTRDLQLVNVTAMTDNPFDWIYTLEHAARLVLIDSCFSNLVEQLNLPNEKYLVLRSGLQVTPVMRNGWRFLVPEISGQAAALRLI